MCAFGAKYQTQHPGLTFAMASAMDSTIPPTIPTSLAASFSVTIMSSTASFMSWAASAMASWVCEACETSATSVRPPQIILRTTTSPPALGGTQPYLRVSSALLGGVEHLQSRLRQGLRLVQESHLLLVVLQLRSHAHRSHDQRLKVTGQLGHLR